MKLSVGGWNAGSQLSGITMNMDLINPIVAWSLKLYGRSQSYFLGGIS